LPRAAVHTSRSPALNRRSAVRRRRSVPRIVIYGFGPYRRFRDNITARILRRLPSSRSIRKIVFPVRFDRKQFVAAVEAFKPDIVLGMGQCSRGRLLRIEARAVNKRTNRKTDPGRPISLRGAGTLPVSLTLNLGGAAKRSTNAGDYVCNFSMYVILDFLKRRQPGTRFGFIHVPYTYDENKAVRLLTRAIEKFSDYSRKGGKNNLTAAAKSR
jgi:pyrrolidone-carboxylate peptidase